MHEKYVYKKPHYNTAYRVYRRALIVSLLVLALAAIIGGFIYVNLHTSPEPTPKISKIGQSVVADSRQTYISPYFKFQDTGGKWILEKNRSNDSTWIYDKYQSNSLLAEVVFYINHDVSTVNGFTRTLPVRIANDDSFEVTGVSNPCVEQYGPNDPHIVKVVEIEGTKMVCNAGSNQYQVVVGEVGGDYRLPMKRHDGTPIQIEITYVFDGLDPDPSSLLNITSSFQTI